MKIQTAAITDIGKKRKVNEDNFLISKDDGLFLIADGMGGHLAGDLASKIAVDTIADFVRSTSEDKEVTWPFHRDEHLPYDANRLIVGIKLANKKIYATARERNLDGMGTTVASVLVKESKAIICHVGDSRIYKISDDAIEQLTEDHSFLNDQLKLGNIKKEDVDKFPYKNVITRALGIEDDVHVDVRIEEAKKGDFYLLCSDGLSNLVKDDTLKEIILRNKNQLIKSCRNLISNANLKGGHDNITAVLIRFS